MASVDIPIGAIVDIPLGRGVVRFFGTTSFSAGKWVGIELSGPIGKNDGSVKGVPYFSCPQNHGVFVKPSQVRVVQDPPSSGTVSTPLYFLAIIIYLDLPQPSSQPVARPSLGHSRTPSTGLSRAPSSRSIPPPSPRATSPSKAGLGQSTRGSARLAPPSPTKRSPIPTTHQQGALKRVVLTPGRPSMGESSINSSRASSRGDSPDSAPPVRTSQLRQVSSPMQQPRDRLMPGVAQASTSTPASSSLSPPPSLPPEPKEPVSRTPNPSFCVNG
jgi:dynactin 1